MSLNGCNNWATYKFAMKHTYGATITTYTTTTSLLTITLKTMLQFEDDAIIGGCAPTCCSGLYDAHQLVCLHNLGDVCMTSMLSASLRGLCAHAVMANASPRLRISKQRCAVHHVPARLEYVFMLWNCAAGLLQYNANVNGHWESTLHLSCQSQSLWRSLQPASCMQLAFANVLARHILCFSKCTYLFGPPCFP